MNFAVPSLALVVEDDPLQREVLCGALKGENLDVIQCESAEAAELVVARFGVELATFARQCCPDLRIIVVSGADRAALPSDVRFFTKPYRISDLLQAVQG